MSEENEKISATSLAQSILQKKTETPSPDEAQEIPLSTDALIELYFESEEPIERDLLFEQLSSIKDDLATNFLITMMSEDADPYMRQAAAGELARRGMVEAYEYLIGQLQHADEFEFFKSAIEFLSQHQGKAILPLLEKIWLDPNRPAAERREALFGIEQTDPKKLLDVCAQFIDTIDPKEHFPDNLLSIALATLAQHDAKEILTHLSALLDRIAQSTLDTNDKEDLSGFIEEGIALLQT
ncbi:MAG: HEAT repeat domain-containing protein [Myxococcota bacterium]|nr:HEAT repeat domain-containing protein [Myxococcota bacterium]